MMWVLPSRLRAEFDVGPARLDAPTRLADPWRLIAFNDKVALASIASASFPAQPTEEELLASLGGELVFRCVTVERPLDVFTGIVDPDDGLPRIVSLEAGLSATGLRDRIARNIQAQLAEELLLRFGVAEWPAWKAHVAQHTPPWLRVPHVPHVRIPPVHRTES